MIHERILLEVVVIYCCLLKFSCVQMAMIDRMMIPFK
jgi:hypothetical protein